METQRPLCLLADIADGNAIEVQLDETPAHAIVLIRHGLAVHAYHNVCPHAGRALNWAPGKFLFTPAGHLVCTAHGATFEAATGRCILGPCMGARLTPVPVIVRAGQVWLDA